MVGRWVRGLLLLLACAVLAQGAFAQSLPPEPEYVITDNGLGIFGRFADPALAEARIESQHLSWPWGTGTATPVYCPADAARLDFTSFSTPSPASALSPYTAWAPIRRHWAVCTANAANGACTAWGCGLDPTSYQYRMRASCPNGWAFDTSGPKPRCECPSGQELERNAAGEWRCTARCVPGMNSAGCYQQDQSCPISNPVLPGIGAKVQVEADLEDAGAHPLSFQRTFRSRGVRPYAEPGAWTNWVHNWGRRIDVFPHPGYRGRAFMVRDDASQRVYATTGNGVWTPTQAGDRNVLIERRNAGGGRIGFEYRVWADDSVEHYSPTGQLLRVVQRNGWAYALTYSDAATPATVASRPGLLISVRNQFGRELRLGYDAAGRLTELVPPGAVAGSASGAPTSPIRYRYAEPASLGAGVPALGQLTSVVAQDGTVRRYHYENSQLPQWLTGKTDELGVRIGIYTYDAYGRVSRSAGPGSAASVELNYNAYPTVTVTDRSGPSPAVVSYRFETAAGVVRPVAVSAPCPKCGTTNARTDYTATGEVARSVAHDGRVTFYSYDDQGRETERVTFGAAYGSATVRPDLGLAERVVSTRWHPTWNLPVEVAEPGKVSVSSHDTSGNLVSHAWSATSDNTGATAFAATKVGSTLQTTYAYNAAGLPSLIIDRVDGLEVRRWTYAHNTTGGPAQVVGTEAGTTHTLNVETSPQHGQVTALTASNGAAAQFSYDARGKLRTAQLPDWSATFEHDARSLLQEVRFGSGAWVRLIYDAAGVPVRVEDSNGVSQVIAGVTRPSTTGPSTAMSQRLADLVTSARIAAINAHRKPLVEWLPLGSAQAQVPLPYLFPAIALQGLARAMPAAGYGTDSGAVAGGGCCGQATQTIARGLEAQFRQITMPAMLATVIGVHASQALLDDFALLLARSKLRSNMLCNAFSSAFASGLSGCYEAHHIVAVHAKAAKPARDILSAVSVNIDINSPVNGVWLRCDKHRRLHTEAYYDKVNARLTTLPVTNTQTVMTALRMIAVEIDLGTF